jgi:hypothetical protein
MEQAVSETARVAAHHPNSFRGSEEGRHGDA